jgi:alpha-L-fucosidase 2
MIRGHAFETRDVMDVRDGDEVIALIGCYPDPSRRLETRSHLLSLPTDYDVLFERHAEAHRQGFMRMDFELETSTEKGCSNERLLLDAYSNHASEELIERMFDYGRYLLFSCASENSFPPTLQGKWNGEYFPPWNSFYVNNENTQMFFWQALPGNMPETTFACFNYFESFLDDFRENAQKLWGCRGIFIPLVTGNATGLLQDTQTHVINFTGTAGWISQLYYDYWLFTRDEAFLRNRAIPFIKEAALFYEDFIVEDPDGYNMFIPSNSPENAPANSISKGTDLKTVMNPGIPITINSTIDMAITKELLTNLSSACDHLGIEKDNVAKWRQILSKMRPYRINEDGALAEWVCLQHTDNYAHRHVSHLYPVFPGFEITQEDEPALFEAAKVAMEKRLSIGLQSQTGWSLAHSANIFARMGHGDKALECLEILTRTCVGQNLFTYHNDWRDMGATLKLILGNHAPYQVDANMGFSAAVLEMLIFSTADTIRVLPSLPKRWKRGKAIGLRCRTGSTVSICWDMEKGTIDLLLKHPHKNAVFLKLPKNSKIVSCSDHQLFRSLKMKHKCYKITLNQTKEVCLKVASKFNEKIKPE